MTTTPLTDEQLSEAADSLAYYAKHGENMYASVRVPTLRRLLAEVRHLRAASPCLLEALKRIVMLWDNHQPVTESDYDAARAAIAKAEPE